VAIPQVSALFHLTLHHRSHNDVSSGVAWRRGAHVVKNALIDGPAASGEDRDSFQELTIREQSILRLAAQGYTNIQIATHLHISKYTVAQHIAKMLRRTGASNRTDLVHRAHVAGALATP
jgi:DNA-binding NarL/FixJ family response regulator